MAQLGYLEREGFYKSLPNTNPLALFAAFEALAKGNNSANTTYYNYDTNIRKNDENF